MSRETPQVGSLLSGLLDRRALRRAAGSRSFERGDDYSARGRVRSLAERQGTLRAKVRGTRPYQVKLWAEDGDLQCLCTCPMGRDGAFCKHGVATGLAWLHEGRAQTGKKSNRSAVTMDWGK